MENEALWYRKLTAAGVQHVLRMFKDVYVGQGGGPLPGADDNLIDDDNLWDDIARVYLEYCPGGDMWEYIRAQYK